jgi:hypothetical protein
MGAPVRHLLDALLRICGAPPFGVGALLRTLAADGREILSRRILHAGFLRDVLQEHLRPAPVMAAEAAPKRRLGLHRRRFNAQHLLVETPPLRCISSPSRVRIGLRREWFGALPCGRSPRDSFRESEPAQRPAIPRSMSSKSPTLSVLR